jgi:hypothetical protein
MTEEAVMSVLFTSIFIYSFLVETRIAIHSPAAMFSFKFGPGAFFFLCALLPLVLADNLFAGCYSTLPTNSVAPTAPVLRSSSLDCSVSLRITLLPDISIII